MQRNNEGQFRSLRTKNDKIWRKISLALIKKEKEKGQSKLSYKMKFLRELLTRNKASQRTE